MVTYDKGTVRLKVLECLEKIVEDKTVLEDITDETDFFEDAIIDSLAAVALVEAIEMIFNIKLSDDEIFGEEFSTIGGVTSLIMRHLAE